MQNNVSVQSNLFIHDNSACVLKQTSSQIFVVKSQRTTEKHGAVGNVAVLKGPTQSSVEILRGNRAKI